MSSLDASPDHRYADRTREQSKSLLYKYLQYSVFVNLIRCSQNRSA
jgi:hypothetical protein